MEIQLRPAKAEDAEFLYSVYVSTRQEELTSCGWDAGQIETFLRMQSRAQDTHYRAYYRGFAKQIVQVDGIDAGRLYTHWAEQDLHILDIALLPAHRSRGVGTRLMGGLLSEAERRSGRVRIFVENFNPAKSLYHRLGFRELGSEGVYTEMLWEKIKDAG